MNKWWLIILAVLITAGLIEVAIVVPQDYKNQTGMFTPARAQKTAVIATELATVEETLTEEETEPETSEIETEETYEQTTSEEEGTDGLVVYETRGEEVAEMATERKGDSIVFTYYGIYSGAYWHFTPEQIDAQWSGLKPSKPRLADGTTRAWQRYLYERLSLIGAEWFYRYAVAQAMQESGFNPLNQQGNDAVPDKGLYSFRIYYWNASFGDIYDYRANIDAYIVRISPYLTDRSEQGIYRTISQHYQPDGTIHMDYVQHVLGRLNELWEVE
jgi:hypothetical protein